MTEYRADPRINASKLKLFAGNNFEPMVALDKLRTPMIPSEAMKLGTAVHAILEHRGNRSAAVKDLIISPFENFRKKEAQEWKKANPEYMTADQLDQAMIMANRVMEVTPEVREGKSLMEQDYYNGEYKALLDIVYGKHGIDYKTTSATSINQWKRDAENYHYALQAAHYVKVAGLKEFSFVAVSSVKPYPVWRFKCTPDYLAYGEHLWGIALERYNKYKDAEIAPSNEAIELSAPLWFEPEPEQYVEKSYSWGQK